MFWLDGLAGTRGNVIPQTIVEKLCLGALFFVQATSRAVSTSTPYTPLAAVGGGGLGGLLVAHWIDARSEANDVGLFSGRKRQTLK